MGHRNLSPDLNRVVAMGDNQELTLDLRTVSAGDKLKIIMGAGDTFTFTIITAAKPELKCVDDSAVAFLPGKQWSNDCTEKEVKVLIGCACTYNPGAPMLMTMMHLGHLTRGRNFAIWKFGTDSAQIFKTPIASITVIKKQKKKKK
jgi:hypothetical protein